MIVLSDADVFAARELRAAQLDGHDAPPWRELLRARGVAVRLFGDDSPIRGVGTHGVVHGTPTVYVHDSREGRDRGFIALHELGHLIVRRESLLLDAAVVSEERWCNRFAAACLAPEDSMRRAWRLYRADLPALALARPQTTDAVIARRLADLELATVWLFKGDRLHVGEVSPTAQRLARLARKEGYADNDNARAWRLRDDGRYVAVIAA